MSSVVEVAGKRIREERKAQGWTLSQLSERTGISTSHLSQVESGKKQLPLERLEQIAKAFQIPGRLLWEDRLDEARARLPLSDGRYLNRLPDTDPIHAGLNRVESWDELGRRSREAIRATLARHRLEVSRGELPHVTEPVLAWLKSVGVDHSAPPELALLDSLLQEHFSTSVTTPDQDDSLFKGYSPEEVARFTAIRQPRKRWGRKPGALHLAPGPAEDPLSRRKVVAEELVRQILKLTPPNNRLGTFLPESLEEVLTNQDAEIGALALMTPAHILLDCYDTWLNEAPPNSSSELAAEAKRLLLCPESLLLSLARVLSSERELDTYFVRHHHYSLDSEHPAGPARTLYFIEVVLNLSGRPSLISEFQEDFCRTTAPARVLLNGSAETFLFQQENEAVMGRVDQREPPYAVIGLRSRLNSPELSSSVGFGIRDSSQALIRAFARRVTRLNEAESGYRCSVCPAQREERCHYSTAEDRSSFAGKLRDLSKLKLSAEPA
jgi:transcriptional regulator with XRE-family HTH domain